MRRARPTPPGRRGVPWMLSAVVVAALALVGAVTFVGLRDSPGGSRTAALGPEGMPLETGPPLAPIAGAADGAPVDGIRCDAMEQAAYHIHAHLAVYVNGALRSVPPGIGVVEPSVTRTSQGLFAQATRCYYWLHTHAQDGVIHVESPTRRQYTLGEFFDIWRQPLTGSRVGPATGPVTAYVNGRPYTGDLRAVELDEREDIQLDVGTATPAPQPVDWSHSQL